MIIVRVGRTCPFRSTLQRRYTTSTIATSKHLSTDIRETLHQSNRSIFRLLSGHLDDAQQFLDTNQQWRARSLGLSSVHRVWKALDDMLHRVIVEINIAKDRHQLFKVGNRGHLDLGIKNFCETQVDEM